VQYAAEINLQYLQYIPTKQQAADGLIKHLGTKKLADFCQLIGLASVEGPKREL
jgi:hypothetical protein